MRIISGSDVRAVTRLVSTDEARDPQVDATAAGILAGTATMIAIRSTFNR